MRIFLAYVRWALAIVCEFLNDVANPITRPPLKFLNRLTGAGSPRLILWLFGTSAVTDMIYMAMKGLNDPLLVFVSLASCAYWCWHSHRLAVMFEELDLDRLPPFGDILLVFVMRAFGLVAVTMRLAGLLNWSGANLLAVFSEWLFLMGLTAAITFHPKRKSWVRKAAEATLDTMKNLVPTPIPAPIPAFVGG